MSRSMARSGAGATDRVDCRIGPRHGFCACKVASRCGMHVVSEVGGETRAVGPCNDEMHRSQRPPERRIHAPAAHKCVHLVFRLTATIVNNNKLFRIVRQASRLADGSRSGLNTGATPAAPMTFVALSFPPKSLSNQHSASTRARVCPSRVAGWQARLCSDPGGALEWFIITTTAPNKSGTPRDGVFMRACSALGRVLATRSIAPAAR